MAEDVYRIRLITQEWPHAAHSVKRIAVSFMAFTRESDPVQKQALYEKFTQELVAFEFAVGKLRSIASRCKDEAAEYQGMQRQIEHSIADLTEELVLLKQQLEDEKRLRLARQKFEESARRVNSMPSRDVLAGRIAAVEADYAIACEERASLDARVAARTAQFGLLMASIAELQQTFADDEEAERRQLASAAAAAAAAAPASGPEADVDMRADEGASDGRRRGGGEDAPSAPAPLRGEAGQDVDSGDAETSAIAANAASSSGDANAEDGETPGTEAPEQSEGLPPTTAGAAADAPDEDDAMAGDAPLPLGAPSSGD